MVAGALSLGFVLGLPLAVAQVYGPRPVRMIAGLYVWFFRGVPVLLLLFLFYFGLFNIIGLDLGMIGSSCTVLGLAARPTSPRYSAAPSRAFPPASSRPDVPSA